jgi:hypothetical protein
MQAMTTRKLLCYCLLGTLVGCSTPDPGGDPAATDKADDASDLAAITSYDVFGQIDPSLGEQLWPNEAHTILSTATVIKTFLQRRFNEGRQDERGHHVFMRDAHAKADGCVRGEVEVRSDIPEDLRQGVFATPGRTFKAWIRFSDGNSEVRSDDLPDARGMAIKLTGVDGTKLIADMPESTTQDFVMINHPVFFVDDPALYLSTLNVFHSGVGFEALGQALSLLKMPDENRQLALAVNGSRIANPLKEVYWSMVPYRLGVPGSDASVQPVKFAVIPVACDNASLPIGATDEDTVAQQQSLIGSLRDQNKVDFFGGVVDSITRGRDPLRAAMERSLGGANACFVLGLQRFVDASRTPIERSVQNWDDVAPFIPVADVTVPRQVFTSDAQDTFCQNLSFTPWHALPAHKPLGAVNRTRLIVYKAISQFRRSGGLVGGQSVGNRVAGAALTGPTGDETF